jgi:hypothetical protein
MMGTMAAWPLERVEPEAQNGSRLCGGGVLTARDGMPASAQRLEHEYTLKGELDSAWLGRPVELSEHKQPHDVGAEKPSSSAAQ